MKKVTGARYNSRVILTEEYSMSWHLSQTKECMLRSSPLESHFTTANRSLLVPKLSGPQLYCFFWRLKEAFSKSKIRLPISPYSLYYCCYKANFNFDQSICLNNSLRKSTKDQLLKNLNALVGIQEKS